jgi:GTP cyclohydrolase FolE2
LVQLPNQCVFVALQIVDFQILLPKVGSERIDFIFELADRSEGQVVAFLEVSVGVGLDSRKGTFS